MCDADHDDRTANLSEEAPLVIRVVRSLNALTALQAAWRNLWQADRAATPFQHPAWLVPWWGQFSQPELRVLTICRGDLLVGLLPLYLLSQPETGEQQMLMVGAGTSDYLDGVFAPKCTVQDVAAGLRTVLVEPGWDVAHLTQLRQTSLAALALQMVGERDGIRVTPYAGEACSRCAASGIADLPAKVRRDVRFYRNAAIGRGKLVLETATKETCEHTFDLLVRFHSKRWEKAGEAGVLADPAVLAWHREAIPRLQAEGLLRLQTLTLAHEPIAVLYSMIDPPDRHERTQYFYLMGHSLAHEELRPGVLLTALAIERAAGEGVRTIDMLRGQEAYKHFWRVVQVPTFGFEVRRATRG